MCSCGWSAYDLHACRRISGSSRSTSSRATRRRRVICSPRSAPPSRIQPRGRRAFPAQLREEGMEPSGACQLQMLELEAKAVRRNCALAHRARRAWSLKAAASGQVAGGQGALCGAIEAMCVRLSLARLCTRLSPGRPCRAARTWGAKAMDGLLAGLLAAGNMTEILAAVSSEVSCRCQLPGCESARASTSRRCGTAVTCSTTACATVSYACTLRL